MPPIKRYRSTGRTRSMPRHQKPKRKRNFKYKTGTTRAGRRGRQVNMNVIKLTTLSRKEENVSISFREELDFTNMGYAAGSSPCVIRANLNNPTILGSQASGNDVLVASVANLKTGSTNPTFTRASYNDQRNLSNRLSEYFDEYRKAVVTSAEVTFHVKPKLNQVNPSANGTVSIVPYFTNDSTGLSPTGNAGLRGSEQQTRWIAGNATGDLYVWCILQQSQQQLYNNTDGVLPLSTLKQGIPGMRMTKLNITPNSTKGVSFKMTYSPQKVFGLKDWRDNKELLAFANGDVPSTFKPAYAYLGIGASIDGQDPDVVANGSKLMANCIISTNIKYNINFSERKNIDGNNEPVAHYAEL